MTYPFKLTLVVYAGAVAWLAGASCGALAADDGGLQQQIETLLRENLKLQETVRQQQGVIEDLSRRVDAVEQRAATERSSPDADSDDGRKSSGLKLGPVSISGEGGLAFFSGQDNSAFPDPQFRVDEARLFVEAPIWGDVYFFSEINLATRENDELELTLGELYLDFEDVSQLWGKSRQLNLRVGRLDVPFGEEYLYRDAIDNPLIAHSVTDFWGVDEGVELYGAFGPVSYVVAVQNGGVPGARDYNSDKSVAARLSYDPNRWLHLSVSAMRTGDLEVEEDELSELWIGGGWFRSIGSTNTTKFHANLVQGDVALKFSRGHLRAFGGFAQYDDDDSLADNQRDFYYYSVEGVLDLTRKFYAAARFSQIFVDGGYPMPGQGDLGNYFFNPFSPRAEELWRATVGVGYRFSRHLVVKTEYSFEGGKEVGGGSRDKVDLFAAQAAFGF